MIFRRSLQLSGFVSLCLGILGLFAVEARGVTLTLYTNSIAVPAGLTFQMPLSGFDADGQPLKFSATVSNKKAVTAAIAPSSNRSLVMNVSGVDGSNEAFTGNITLQLFEDLTPLTTGRIIDLVNSNFYNGLLFQRVISNFVAQAGGSTNDPNFESGVSLDDEYVASLTYDGFGQLGMANAASSTGQNSTHDSNDSQFFITDVDLSVDNPSNTSPLELTFEQPIFGQLTSGFDVFSQIMSTPVGPSSSGENSAPLSNVVINTAIITNSQDGVLRLTASPKFKGTVTVTVSATNAERVVATQLLQVKVIPNTNNVFPPFLGPIPSNTTVTQNTAATFIFHTTDISGNTTLLALLDQVTSAFPTNLTVSIVPKTGQIWFNPDLTVTGAVQLILEAGNDFQNPDSQDFTLTFVPFSASPTMMIKSLKGKLQDGSKPGRDSINVSGTFNFIGESDHTFSSNDVVSLTLGDATTPLVLKVTPDKSGWKFRNGSINARELLTSGLDSNINVSVRFNKAGSFNISAKNFDFPAAISNQVVIGIAVGNDYATNNVQTWIQQNNGVFMTPSP